MLKIICLAIVCCFSLQSFGSGTQSGFPVKGYREWKNEKVQTAMVQILNLKGQILKTRAEGNKKNSDVLEKQLAQVQFNLDVVRDLAVTDYFVLYLSKQPQSDRFQQAALKMTTNEVAELMEAYADTLSNSTPVEAAAQQVIPYPISLHKLPIHNLQARDQVK